MYIKDCYHKVFYRHFRYWDQDGNVLNNGGVTIAYTLLKKDHILLAASFCSLKDRFCRATGRILAEGRLNMVGQSVLVELEWEKFHKYETQKILAENLAKIFKIPNMRFY
jgi:hypothetical protein